MGNSCIVVHAGTVPRFEGTGRCVGVLFFLCCLLWGTGTKSSTARSFEAPSEGVRAVTDTSRLVVRSVEVEGNEHFSESELKQQIRTSPNRRVFGIPGFTWWRWLYQLGSADWMWDRLGGALQSGGEPPAYVDSTTVNGDEDRLELFYEQHGFRDARVTADVRQTASDRASVVFQIEPGPATRLRQVRYDGLARLSAAQRERFVQGSAFEDASPMRRDSLVVDVGGKRFQRSLLLDERQHLLSFLQQEGYAAVSRDSVRAVLGPVHERTEDGEWRDVTFQVDPGPRYRVGAVRMYVTGTESSPVRRDTLNVSPGVNGRRGPQVVSEIRDESYLRPGLLRRSLQFAPGSIYDRSEVTRTKQRFDGTGVFAFTNITPELDQVTSVDSLSDPFLPIRIEAQTRQRHQLRAETFALQRRRAEVIGLNEFGLGASGVYENLNAFGGGEAFQLRVSGSVATALDSSVISSRQLEATGSLTLPYLIRPFNQFENVFDLTNARTQISLSGLTARRNDLRLQIRSRINARLRLEMNHTPSRTSLVDVIDLNISNPDTLSGFGRRFLSRVFGTDGQGIQDPVQRQQVLEDYTRPQINTAQRYTLRSSTADPLRRQTGHIYEVSAEVGNTIPRLLDRFVLSPDTVEYTLPGITGGSGTGLGGRLLYRPYVRATVDLRRYKALGQESTLALKFLSGVAHPTGGLTVVPFDRRFFSGGANSVRGWRLRDLGPGGTGPVDRPGAVGSDVSSILGGDLKLETSVELRSRLLHDFLTTDWVGAAFLDAGNVWFGPRNEGFEGSEDGDVVGTRNGKFRGVGSLTDVGVGGGFGLRLHWDFIILRFDLAYRLHDPAPANNDIFGDSFSGPLIHFGIGQAF